MPRINWEVEKGHLGAEPEIDYLEDNRCMARVSIAVNRYRYDKETEEYEQVGIVSWINAVAFGYQAELIEMMELQKGDAVFAKGMMYQDEYEDKEGYLVVDWNYYIDQLFPIPQMFEEEDEDEGRSRGRRKKKRRSSSRKSRSSRGGGSRRSSRKSRSSGGSRVKKKRGGSKPKRKDKATDMAQSVINKLKNS